ncbi:uncharacterized protein LOC128226503 isoform X2 [Mya arenaria]|uniref:uncharacterized protein LOC128226503 isoform X2 n=1 Tax=Mya arenaria TaxID=6604 RepID=UPI0022E82B5C|nr:uncharacterized protein LOC128226503 isoform X2 [Mya arenaria]
MEEISRSFSEELTGCGGSSSGVVTGGDDSSNNANIRSGGCVDSSNKNDDGRSTTNSLIGNNNSRCSSTTKHESCSINNSNNSRSSNISTTSIIESGNQDKTEELKHEDRYSTEDLSGLDKDDVIFLYDNVEFFREYDRQLEEQNYEKRKGSNDRNELQAGESMDEEVCENMNTYSQEQRMNQHSVHSVGHEPKTETGDKLGRISNGAGCIKSSDTVAMGDGLHGGTLGSLPSEKGEDLLPGSEEVFKTDSWNHTDELRNCPATQLTCSPTAIESSKHTSKLVQDDLDNLKPIQISKLTQESLDKNDLKRTKTSKLVKTECNSLKQVNSAKLAQEDFYDSKSVKTSEQVQEVSDHLKPVGSECVNGSVNKATACGDICLTGSWQSGVSQSAYQLHDRGCLGKQLGNSRNDSRMKAGEIMLPLPSGVSNLESCADSNDKSHSVETDRRDFREENIQTINVSIDELICPDKNEGSDTLKALSSGDLSCSDMCSGRMESESVGSGSGAQSEGSVTGDNMVAKESGETVVETDAGFYWLTCSIVEPTGSKDIKCNKGEIPTKLESETSESKQVDSGRKVHDKSGEDNNDNVGNEMTSVHICVTDSEGNSNVKKGDRNQESLESGSHVNSEGSNRNSSDLIGSLSEDHVKRESQYSSDGNSVISENSDSFSGSKQDIMVNSTPDLFQTDHLDAVDGHSERKLSYPENIFKVFKVVSIDIPKMNLFNHHHGNHKHDKHKTKSSEAVLMENKIKPDHNRHSAEFDKKHDRKPHRDDKNASRGSLNTDDKNLSWKHSLPSSILRLPSSFKSKSYKMGEARRAKSQDREVSLVQVLDLGQGQPNSPPDGAATPMTQGPILDPPPSFASTEQNASGDTDGHTVWDPGSAVPSSSSCFESGETTPTNPAEKSPCSPLLPSPACTEKLISWTILQHNRRKYSVDMIRGVEYLKLPDTARRKSFDSGIQSEYAEIDEFKQTGSSEKCNNAPCVQKWELPNGKTAVGPQFPYGGLKLSENNNKLETGDKNGDSECPETMDILDAYHHDENSNNSGTQNYSELETLCHTPKTEVHANDPSAIYATVDKRSKANTVDSLSTEPKKEPVECPVSPPKIPPKPKHLSEQFGNKPLKDSTGEASPEMQIMFNSLSPVLIRRHNSKNRLNRRNSSSTETSPESTPDISPRVQKNVKPALPSRKKPEESLFMDPKMAQTWHGTTSANWSNIYGPQMRAMMRELNALTNNADYDSSTISVDDKFDDYQERSKTLQPKSLLDEMHKKFCSDQYKNEREAAIARSLILFRLKSHPTTKPKRSQSFNIRMGMGTTYSRLAAGASSSSASSELSPLIPRASERLRIKTRPDAQYSPKPGRPRARTPDPPRICEEVPKAEAIRKEEAEIEAIEACRWLRETGFPQYAQLYEDGQFPLDIESVENDHDFLDKEDIQSLFRRLNTLNKCAIMKIGTPTKKESEDSDEDDQCALSDKWKYQRSSRRWSRKDLEGPLGSSGPESSQPGLTSSSSHDSLLADQNSSSETGDSPVLDSKMLHLNDDVFKTFDANGNATIGNNSKMYQRASSERMKGAKGFLKRMESLKRGRTKKHRTIDEISSPVITNNAVMQAKIRHLNCQDIYFPINSVKTPVNHGQVNGLTDRITSPRNESLTVLPTPVKTDSNSNNLNSSVVSQNSSASARVSHVTSTPRVSSGINAPPSDLVLSGNNSVEADNSSGFSANGAQGLDVSMLRRQSNSSETTNSSEDTVFNTSENKPGKFPTLLDDSLFASDKSNPRYRSFSYTDENSAQEMCVKRRSLDPRKQLHRVSIYDNVPVEDDLTAAQEELDIILSDLFQNINGLNRAINGDDAELLEPPSLSSLDNSSVISSQSETPEPEAEDRDSYTPAPEPEVISGTLSSPDISDQELQTEETSHDDSAEHIIVRERRDSGVGSSLTRTNSERRKYRIRWHSFQKSHRPTCESRNLQLTSLSARQILVLRKLLLLKLTALIEKFAPNRSGWSLTVPRFMKRNKVPDYRDKNVFGVPFSVMIQRTGQALPQCILHAMRYLRRTSGDAVGIFRKPGVRARIQKLRNDIEANPEAIDFEDLQPYDVADLIKLYFRELPECLLTNKLSEIFITIFIYVPSEQRLEALQAAILLMNDENRDVLQSLLLFLSDIVKQSDIHQMTASNLAVCFAPSLFNMGGARNPSQTPSPRRNRKSPGIPDARELMEQKAAHECLTLMVQECKRLFTISSAYLSKCRVLHEDPVSIDELNSGASDGNQGYAGHIDACIQGLLKESREKFRGWVSSPSGKDVDLAFKKVGDGHPLRLWKCTVDIEAPPEEVLNKILHDRQQWDEDLLQWHTVEKLDEQTEVFQYVRNSMAPHPTRDLCVLRSWRTDLPKGACVLISTSIDHPRAELLGGLRAVELASRYLIEPCGTGKSRLTHISRVDIRGHSPDWYKKVYGHICANFVEKIRSSFQSNTAGPETKV